MPPEIVLAQRLRGAVRLPSASFWHIMPKNHWRDVMGFNASSCSFTRFRVLDPVENGLVAQVPDLLRGHSFQDIDESPEIRSFGWVPFDDMLDSGFSGSHPRTGPYMLFSLRLDTRRVPHGVIRKHMAIALKKEMESSDPPRKFVVRERKKEIRENVMAFLLKRFLPVPGMFNVIWNLENNEVWFASTQAKMIDLFMELFLNTFELHLEQLTPASLALTLLDDDQAGAIESLEPSQFLRLPSSLGDSSSSPDIILGEEFLTWLWYRGDTSPDSFINPDGSGIGVAMEQRIVVRGGEGESRETASVSGSLSPLREARFGLRTGKKVSRAHLRLEKDGLAYQVFLNADDFRISGMRTPKIEHDKDNDDPDASILEKIFLLEEAIKLMDVLYIDFLKTRLGCKWSEEIDAMGKWLLNTGV